MRPDLRQISIAGTRKNGGKNRNGGSLQTRYRFHDKAAFHHFIGGRRGFQAERRRIAEARRARLLPWDLVQRDDIRAQAQEFGVSRPVISRDYQILRAREFVRVATLAGLVRVIAGMPIGQSERASASHLAPEGTTTEPPKSTLDPTPGGKKIAFE